VNERGVYGTRGAARCPSITIGSVASETKRVHTNLVLIGIGALFGVVGWHNYRQAKPLGVISLGASGSLVASGIGGLLLDREGT
jgi:hypothetical protein